MSAAAVCSPAEAIAAIAFFVAWNGGVIPVYLDRSPVPNVFLKGTAGEMGLELAERAARWDMLGSKEVAIGLPWSAPSAYGPGKVTVLWAWAETRDSVWRAAKRFPVAPSVALKMGGSCRRLLLWGLDSAEGHVLVQSDNRRIAYRLGAPQKWAEPERLRIPLPGTFLRVGRTRPAPVLVTRLEPDCHDRRQIAGRLKDPPAPYMQRLREGKVKKR